MKTKSYTTNHERFRRLSDLELFKLIQERDKGALETIFNRHYDGLCRFGLSYTNEQNSVEEVVSDVFLQLWNNETRIQEIRNPKPYLYVVVKNKLLQAISKSNLKQSFDQGFEAEYTTSPSIEQQIINQEEKEIFSQKIEEILCQIPKKSRQIFEMSRLDELKYREISEILGISVKTVESHMAHALKIIRSTVLKKKQY
ncbi:RNA polymerase sigma factor [Zobellia alginiliquefaciens]|uniref:RNA polymerase sigma factor n=1 Tax=Zobellia alginiliquefaciens TaxID=3032586 RepID=UPI0023E3B585|nr:RNA polymerase sigma-70 factor [Zobellia alginiliquefaciens]